MGSQASRDAERSRASAQSESQSVQGSRSSAGSFRITRKSTVRRRSKLDFPMYVVPIEKMLKIDEFLPHEEMMLREDLEIWQEGIGDVIFFSHVWLSNTHPDPDGVQWNVMKAAVQQMRQGLKIRVFWQQEFLFGAVSMCDELKDIKFAWIDYLCVPQAPEHRKQQMECINCIYGYVHNADHFMVIAPPAKHREKDIVYDYHTWGRRGWCRTEMFCNSIGKDGKVLVAEGPTSFYIDMAGGRDAFLRPPGYGQFTCDEDKKGLAPVLERLINYRINEELEEGNMFDARLMMAGRHQVLAGLPVQERPKLPLNEWLEAYKFNSPVKGDIQGWTPFRYAVYEYRYDIAKQLLEATADVESPLQEAVPGVGYHSTNCTVLMALAFMRDDAEGIRFLLENRANVQSNDENNQTPLHMAAVVGAMSNIQALVEAKGDIHAVNKFGDDAAGSAVFGGQKEAAMHLIQLGSLTLTHTVTFGWRSAMGAIVCDGDTEVLKAVIELRADVNWRSQPLPGFGQVACRGCQAAYYFQWQDPSEVIDLFSQTPGMTPLCCAAHFGNVEAIRVLLAADADASLTNDYGRTPLHFAAIKGHIGALDLLVSTSPTMLDLKDTWGRTAAMWAKELGNQEALQTLLQAGASDGAFNNNFACCPCRTTAGSAVDDDVSDGRILSLVVQDEKEPVHNIAAIRELLK